MDRMLRHVASGGTSTGKAVSVAKSLLRSTKRTRRANQGQQSGQWTTEEITGASRGQPDGQWTTEDIPEEGVPSFRELRERVVGAASGQPVDGQSVDDWVVSRQGQLARPDWYEGPEGSRQNLTLTTEQGTRPQSQHWPTALVTLLPSWKDDMTVAEAREKWKTFITQFEKVILMQPGAFTENQKRVLLTVKGGQLIQKLLETLDFNENVNSQNVYQEAKKVCSDYFDSNSMRLVDMTTFRNMAQNKDEPFTTYVARLRNKARVCQFGVEQEAVEVAQQIMNGAIDKREFLNSAVLFPDMKLADLERLGTRFEMTRSLRTEQSHVAKLMQTKSDPEEFQLVNAVFNRDRGRAGNGEPRREMAGPRGQSSVRYQPYGGRDSRGGSNFRKTSGDRHEGGQQEEYLCDQYCGRRHVKGKCPAYGKRCDNCGKL